MLVESMTSPKGNTVANQFKIFGDNGETFFQSYSSIIARISYNESVKLDAKYWNYSRTTSKYLSKFLNEPMKDIKRKVKEGVYQLVNLN